MKFDPHMHANLMYFVGVESVEDDYDEDSLGVGAMMPQDMPEYKYLAETEAYGI
jgi:hypothetical protein